MGLFTVPGWASLIFVICLLGGIQLTVLGLIGEYLGRTYEESLHRPLYIVSNLAGISHPPHLPPGRAVIAPPRQPNNDHRHPRPSPTGNTNNLEQLALVTTPARQNGND